MLFLQLSTSLSLLPLNALALLLWQHLLVFNTKLPSLQFESIHGTDNDSSVIRAGEVCESQAAKDSAVEMVVERIWNGKVHILHHFLHRFPLDCEGDILDNDGSRNQLIRLVCHIRAAATLAYSLTLCITIIV